MIYIDNFLEPETCQRCFTETTKPIWWLQSLGDDSDDDAAADDEDGGDYDDDDDDDDDDDG